MSLFCRFCVKLGIRVCLAKCDLPQFDGPIKTMIVCNDVSNSDIAVECLIRNI